MAQMKKLQPEMERIKERFTDDQVKQQQEIMELYKREKVNPLAGCVPILIQIPVFFSLYKVLLRHHRDAPGAVLRLDPRSLGARSDLDHQSVRAAALPSAAFIPAFLSIGIWPILMGITSGCRRS